MGHISDRLLKVLEGPPLLRVTKLLIQAQTGEVGTDMDSENRDREKESSD